MKKRKGTLPFAGTAEQEKKLREVIAAHGARTEDLLAVLQEAQEIYGYLPVEVQSVIAGALNIPLSEVYGVATFYAQFSLSPKGKYMVSVCLGTACYVKGAQKVLDACCGTLGIKPEECTADGKFSIDACRCIGACGLAPVMTVGDEVYGRLKDSEVAGILKKYQAVE